MAEKVPKTIKGMDVTIRESLINHLRDIQTILFELKAFAADKETVDRYRGQESQKHDPDLDPETPADVTAIMRDIEDVYKQIVLYRGKVRGKDGCTIRDSDVAFADDVQNEALLTQQAEAALNSARRGTRPRLSVEESAMTRGRNQ